MQHELDRVVKKLDGTQVKISVVWSDYANKFIWGLTARGKNKRKWLPLEYDKLSLYDFKSSGDRYDLMARMNRILYERAAFEMVDKVHILAAIDSCSEKAREFFKSKAHL